MFPLHCLAPGVQTPAQLPAVQTKGQLVPFVQAPVASQVCGVRLLQTFEPGRQTPEHWPVVHR